MISWTMNEIEKIFQCIWISLTELSYKKYENLLNAHNETHTDKQAHTKTHAQLKSHSDRHRHTPPHT